MGKAHLSPLTALALDDPDHAIKILDFEKESEVRMLMHKRSTVELEEGEDEPPGAHEGKVTSVAFNHDDSILASSSEDGILKFWDLSNGNELGTIPPHVD